MRALHLCQTLYDSIETPRSDSQLLELSMTGSHGNQLIDTLAAVGYWQAGLCVGLAQGYAYAAAETCHALGFIAWEGQLRRVLPQHTELEETAATSSVLNNACGDRRATASTAGPSPLPTPPDHPTAWHLDPPANTDDSQGLGYSTTGTAAAMRGHKGAPAPPELQAWLQAHLQSPAGQGTTSSSYLADTTAAPRTPAPERASTSAAAPATTAVAPALAAASAVTTAAGTASDLHPTAVEFVPLTGDFELGQFRQIPASAIAPQQLQPQDPTHQSLLQGGQHTAQDDLEHQKLSAVADLDRRLSSFALDHISPTTTATTLAMSPASFMRNDDEDEDGDVGNTGMDVGVGPLEPVEGELDLPITNSKGSNLLPSSWPFSNNGDLAATAAAAAAAVAEATATHGSEVSYLDTGSAHAATQRKSGEYKIGLPAQRFVGTPQSPHSAVSSNACSPSVSAQFNACFTRQAAHKPQHQQQGVETGQGGRNAGQFSISSKGHTTSGPSDQTPARAAGGGSCLQKGSAAHVKFAEPGSVTDTNNRVRKVVPVTQAAGALAGANQGFVPIERQGSVASSDTSADVGDQRKRVGLIGRLRRQFSGRSRHDSI